MSGESAVYADVIRGDPRHVRRADQPDAGRVDHPRSRGAASRTSPSSRPIRRDASRHRAGRSRAASTSIRIDPVTKSFRNEEHRVPHVDRAACATRSSAITGCGRWRASGPVDRRVRALPRCVPWRWACCPSRCSRRSTLSDGRALDAPRHGAGPAGARRVPARAQGVHWAVGLLRRQPAAAGDTRRRDGRPCLDRPRRLPVPRARFDRRTPRSSPRSCACAAPSVVSRRRPTTCASLALAVDA